MILKFIQADHFVFHKSYVRPKVKKNQGDDLYQIPDDEGFFDGLPETEKVKRAKIPGITKQMKIERKKRLLEEAHAHLNQKLAQEQ